MVNRKENSVANRHDRVVVISCQVLCGIRYLKSETHEGLLKFIILLIVQLINILLAILK